MLNILKMEEAPPHRLRVEPSGYDEEFVSKVDDDLFCVICHSPLKDPVQTICGHRFCKECLEEHFKRCVSLNEFYILHIFTTL